jgi:hypothetical protein
MSYHRIPLRILRAGVILTSTEDVITLVLAAPDPFPNWRSAKQLKSPPCLWMNVAHDRGAYFCRSVFGVEPGVTNFRNNPATVDATGEEPANVAVTESAKISLVQNTCIVSGCTSPKEDVLIFETPSGLRYGMKVEAGYGATYCRTTFGVEPEVITEYPNDLVVHVR